jgi:uncharacterized protein YjbI with pentapeptide repeats
MRWRGVGGEVKNPMFNRLSNLSNRTVLLILIIVALASSGLSLVVNIVNQVDTSPAWWVSWLQNFSTEMFGAFLTFVLLTLIVGNRQEKERLIRQMRSSINEEAVRAVEELRARSWLTDGSLRSAVLEGANLQGANLMYADLRGAILTQANMENVNMLSANLQGVYLRNANLKKARLGDVKLIGSDMGNANLQGAYLRYANMEGTRLVNADLRDANMEFANLQYVLLGNTQFNEKTLLPDGSKWLSNRDIERFTDPNHHHFENGYDPKSDAYRGKGEG